MTAASSTPGEGEKRFLHLSQSDFADHLQLEMRQVRQFARNDHRIDDRGGLDREGLIDRGFQLTRPAGGKPVSTARAGQGCKVGVGKFDACSIC